MKKKKLLVLTGGGDCPGLNAVIRGLCKAAFNHGGWEAYGSIEAFNGVLMDPVNIKKLNKRKISGIHVKGGTILQTTNKGNPLNYPKLQADGSFKMVDISADLVKKIKKLGFDAVVNIGGDGSQKISQALYEKGLNIIGVPKTIDNDLNATDYTFGFTTAVQTATDSLDRLVSTAESHHRVMIMEVMGRDAGWIALHTAIAGGAEICLIPEIPYSVDKILKRIKKRYRKGRGFVNIVISEGAKTIDGKIVGKVADDGDENIKLGGVGNQLRAELELAKCEAQVRATILGHTQRGGTPVAFDRILATSMGVKAFELIEKKKFGQMVSFTNNEFISVPLKKAISKYNYVGKNNQLLGIARSLGISFGD